MPKSAFCHEKLSANIMFFIILIILLSKLFQTFSDADCGTEAVVSFKSGRVCIGYRCFFRLCGIDVAASNIILIEH